MRKNRTWQYSVCKYTASEKIPLGETTAMGLGRAWALERGCMVSSSRRKREIERIRKMFEVIGTPNSKFDQEY